jgi:transcriptional regulator with XRE-family HTH domain
MDMQRAARGTFSQAGTMGGLAPPQVIDVHVGSRLRSRRIERALSQQELGRYLGVTFSQVQKYEKGSNRIGAGRLYHAAAALGTTVQYFFEGLDSPQKDPVPPYSNSAASDWVRLQDAFARISDPEARQALLALASSMSAE